MRVHTFSLLIVLLLSYFTLSFAGGGGGKVNKLRDAVKELKSLSSSSSDDMDSKSNANVLASDLTDPTLIDFSSIPGGQPVNGRAKDKTQEQKQTQGRRYFGVVDADGMYSQQLVLDDVEAPPSSITLVKYDAIEDDPVPLDTCSIQKQKKDESGSFLQISRDNSAVKKIGELICSFHYT
jgi:hypothetical protein